MGPCRGGGNRLAGGAALGVRWKGKEMTLVGESLPQGDGALRVPNKILKGNRGQRGGEVGK